MDLIRFLNKKLSGFLFISVVLSLVTSVSNIILLFIINFCIQKLAHSEKIAGGFILGLCFFNALLIYIGLQKIFQKYLIEKTQLIVEDIRKSVVQRICESDYSNFESIDNEKIIVSLTNDVYMIMNAVALLVYTFTSMFMINFCLVYIGYYSVLILVITLVTILLAVLIYFINEKNTFALLQKTRDEENIFFKLLNHLIGGIKELKISKKKEASLYNEILTSSQILSNVTSGAFVRLLSNSLTGQFAFFILIGAIIFVIPQYNSMPGQKIVNVLFILLYMVGIVQGFVQVIPQILRAGIAVKNLEQLQTEMESTFPGKTFIPVSQILPVFEHLTIENLSYEYSKTNFKIGPISLTANKGEIIFIIGGNGSGKTTFLKLLTGLYHPQDGVISINQQSVSNENHHLYSQHFSAVFSDFYLFEKLYGLENIDELKVNDLLILMQLDNKVVFEDGRFSNINLSSGQRRRLAFITCLLEDKSIIVLDELAADQDPQFKDFFYNKILPELKLVNKLVIAITHDEKYFNKADKIYQMEDGQLKQYNKSNL